MIWESRYWKEPLLASAERFRSSPSLNEEEDFVSVEKDVMIGFYSIRKLMDTVKISDSTKVVNVALSHYYNKGKTVNWVNSHKLAELFDLETKKHDKKTIRFLCNQIVHSFIFAPTVNDDGNLDGVFFSSDQKKNDSLFHIDLSEIIRVFELVGNDYPAHSHTVRNSETGELVTKSW